MDVDASGRSRMGRPMRPTVMRAGDVPPSAQGAGSAGLPPAPGPGGDWDRERERDWDRDRMHDLPPLPYATPGGQHDPPNKRRRHSFNDTPMGMHERMPPGIGPPGSGVRGGPGGLPPPPPIGGFGKPPGYFHTPGGMMRNGGPPFGFHPHHMHPHMMHGARHGMPGAPMHPALFVPTLAIDELFESLQLVHMDPEQACLPPLSGNLRAGPHGEPTPMETIFGLGVCPVEGGQDAADTDSKPGSGKGEERPTAPLSPLVHTITYSPIREQPPPVPVMEAPRPLRPADSGPMQIPAALPPPPVVGPNTSGPVITPVVVSLRDARAGAGPGSEALPHASSGSDLANLPPGLPLRHLRAIRTNTPPTLAEYANGLRAQGELPGPPWGDGPGYGSAPPSAPGSAMAGPGHSQLPFASAGPEGLPPAPVPLSGVPRVSSLTQWSMQQGAAAAGVAAGGSGPAGAGTPLHSSGAVPGGGADGQPEITGDAEGDEWNRPMSTHHAETWDSPDESFEAYVGETVRHRLGKYVQPDHPNCISADTAHSLYRKIKREVVEKERRAYDERRQQGVFKLIEKRKLENNIKEFVRLSIRRFHTQH